MIWPLPVSNVVLHLLTPFFNHQDRSMHALQHRATAIGKHVPKCAAAVRSSVPVLDLAVPAAGGNLGAFQGVPLCVDADTLVCLDGAVGLAGFPVPEPQPPLPIPAQHVAPVRRKARLACIPGNSVALRRLQSGGSHRSQGSFKALCSTFPRDTSMQGLLSPPIARPTGNQKKVPLKSLPPLPYKSAKFCIVTSLCKRRRKGRGPGCAP